MCFHTPIGPSEFLYSPSPACCKANCHKHWQREGCGHDGRSRYLVKSILDGARDILHFICHIRSSEQSHPRQNTAVHFHSHDYGLMGGRNHVHGRGQELRCPSWSSLCTWCGGGRVRPWCDVLTLILVQAGRAGETLLHILFGRCTLGSLRRHRCWCYNRESRWRSWS